MYEILCLLIIVLLVISGYRNRIGRKTRIFNLKDNETENKNMDVFIYDFIYIIQASDAYIRATLSNWVCKPEIKKDAGVITNKNAGIFPKFL